MIPNGQARLAGVMGWPIGHSLSPRLHGYWLDRYGINGAYVPLAVPADAFEGAFRALPLLGFAGVNVTIPYKEAALAAVDDADETARRIGAANTITVRPDGSLYGQNSDAFGFITNLKTALPDWRAAEGPAVVIGAGGAARAVCVALLDAGVPEVRIANRTVRRADSLARDIGGPFTVTPWPRLAAAMEGAALLVNTTGLGMTGEPPLEVDLRHLSPEAVVTDIVYSPLETSLLAAARARGNRTVDGLGMLLHQGRPGFARWFGTEPDVTPALREFVLAGLAPAGR
jgi:shikimate dehydrogenase